MKYHKCHLKIKVGTRTEDRVAAGVINFNLIFSSEPTDSGPSESKFQIAPAFNPIDPFVMIKSVFMFMVYSAYIVITDNIR